MCDVRHLCPILSLPLYMALLSFGGRHVITTVVVNCC